jgi:hypothetical protein
MIGLSGCGENASDPPKPAGGGAPASSTAPASMVLLAGSPQLDSDGATTVTLTANVKDVGNRALKDQDVVFSTNSGVLVVTNAKTDANGNATATLGTGGDPTNRTITVTATTGGLTVTNTVNVTGTTISISGLKSISFGDFRDLTIFLKNSAGTGIAGKTIAVTSAKGNALAPQPTYVTSASGQITIRVTATKVDPADTITAAAIGATKTFELEISAAILNINPPAPGQKININTWQAVTATYTNGGVPVIGATVAFTTTRGTLNAASALTDNTGAATVNVRSTNSGPAEIAASVANGPSTQVAVEFIATNPVSVIAQASPAVIGTNAAGMEGEKSLITAVVRDASHNLVAGQTVEFTILSDVSGGRLSPASATTDSYGTANAYFIAGGATTPLNGVEIRATVGALSAKTTLTVGGKALFITLATGNEITPVSPNTYQKDFIALVTDAAGHPVQNAVVVPTVTPMHYKKGYYTWRTTLWVPVETLATGSSTLPAVPACINEDYFTRNPLYDFNGILDPGEDQNGNDQLDPGNVASVTATNTDSTGRSIVSVVYARDYCHWTNVKLEAWTGTSGSTASAASIFDLPCSGEDMSKESAAPPGQPSPFGISTSCFVDLTVTPVSSSQISLAWQKTLLAASYNVYRDGALLKNVLLNTTEDTGLASSTRYCYEIKKVDSSNVETSFTKAPVCASTPAVASAPPPATPTGLAATPGVGPQVALTWTHTPTVANPTVAALYNIYRGSSVGGPLALELSAVASGVIDAGVAAKTGYCYAVTAVSVSGDESPKSSQACTATP